VNGAPYTAPPIVAGLSKRAFIVGLVALVVYAVGGALNPTQFFQSYLIGFLLWCGVSLGCMGILMTVHLSGGAWGLVIRRPLEAATRTIPLLPIFFLPIIFGVHHIYGWATPGHVTGHQAQYLNVPFFIVRAAFYFLCWCTLPHFLNKWSLEQDRHPGYAVTRRLQLVSGPGLVLYGLTMTFASVDWIMSLEPHWYSSIFGMIIVIGQVLSAMAFVIMVMLLLSRYDPMSKVLLPRHFHDMGKMLLTFVMVWAYFAFSELLIIWAGNLPEEIPWYLHRLQTTWKSVSILIVLFHFAVPFAFLLSRDLKRNAAKLGAVAAGLFFMRWLDLYWSTAPEFYQGALHFSWMDAAAPLGLGGIWLGAYFWQLQKMPLLPLGDGHLQQSLGPGEDE
jgi:hypothetical protein